MANRIRVSTEWLEKSSRELAGIQSSIDKAAGMLSGIQLRRDEGGSLKVSLNCGLKMTGGRFSGSTAAEDIRQLHQATQALSGSVAEFSGKALRAAQTLEAAEKFALSTIGALMTQKGSDTYTDGNGGSLRDRIHPGIAGKIIQDIIDDGKTDRERFEDLIEKVNERVRQGASQQDPLATWAKVWGYPEDRSKWTPDMVKKAQEALKDSTLYHGANGETILVMGTTTAVMYANGALGVTDSTWREHSIKFYNPDGSYIESKDEVSISSTFGQWKPVEPEDIWSAKDTNGGEGYKLPKREKTLFEVSAESKMSESAFHWENKYENGNYSNSTTVDVGKVEASAKISAGLYSTKYDKDGNPVKVLEPGIGAEIGVSVTALEVTHKGRYGNEVAGLDYGVGVKGPSASAKADAELGIVDGHLSAHAGASAEIIGGELTGEAGVDVLGVEAKVKGSVNYGIGAHADAGFHDGKFSCDVGVSVGVGASVKFEVDYGKAVDKAVTTVQNAYNGAKDTVKAVKGACESWFGKNGIFRW